MAVLSNKPEEFTVPICEALLAAWPFVQFRGPQGEATRKPDPTQALELAEEMDRPPPNVYFVGDSAVDVETARNAGMIPVAVTWGYRDIPELENSSPAYIIDHPADLTDLVR